MTPELSKEILLQWLKDFRKGHTHYIRRRTGTHRPQTRDEEKADYIWRRLKPHLKDRAPERP